MIAAIPPWLQDLGSAAPALTLAGVVVGLVMRAWRKFMLDNVSGPIAELRKYVYFHLGPNGTTTPVHKRLERIETIQRDDAVTATARFFSDGDRIGKLEHDYDVEPD